MELGASSSNGMTRTSMPPSREHAPRDGTLRVLLALGAERTRTRLLQEAADFSLALGAELHVMRVVAHASIDASSSDGGTARAGREGQRLIAAAHHPRALCDRILNNPLPGERFSVRMGTFVDQVALRASEVGADLIAVSPHRRSLEATVQRLAQQADCPILVPRNCRTFATLLAATDLEEPNTPLLRRAARLGRDLDATVVALHGVLEGASRNPVAPSLEQSLLMLESATRSLGGRFESVVLRASDLARKILDQARQRNADIIVVGVRPLRDPKRHPSTAAQVMRRSRRSVLVAPLAAHGNARRKSHAS
jgi:nucleotide-binding universal stress UspA family protein